MIDFNEEELQLSCARILLGFGAFANFVFAEDASERLVGESLRDLEADEIAALFPDARLLAAPFANSPLTQMLTTLYGFVTTGVFAGSENDFENLRHELIPFRESWPFRLAVSVSAEPLSSWPVDSQRITAVLAHFDARLALMEHGSVTITDLALLAGLSEKSVRMAANPKNKDPLVTAFNTDDKRTYIDSDEALRWLGTKRGFKPTVFREGGDIPVTVASMQELGALLVRRRQDSELAIEDVAAAIKSSVLSDEYRALEAGAFTVALTVWNVVTLSELAEVLQITPPQDFVRSAALLLARQSIESQLQKLN